MKKTAAALVTGLSPLKGQDPRIPAAQELETVLQALSDLDRSPIRLGAEAGLALMDALLARGELLNYRLLHAARADLCRRLGRKADAREAYERALTLTQQAAEQRFLRQRLAAL